MWRKPLIGLGVVAVLGLIVALALPGLLDVNRFRSQIENKLEQQLGREITLGEMSYSLVPLAFRVETATISEDPQVDSDFPFVQIGTFFIQPRLLPLLRREVQIDSLQFDNPKLELIRKADGTWNFMSLVTGRDGEKRRFSFDQLKIYNGQVAITDLQQGEPRAVYDHIDLILDDFNPDQRFSIRARAHLPGAEDETIALEGGAGPLRLDGISQTPLEGTLDLDNVSLAAFRRFTHVALLENSDAVLTGTATVENLNGNWTSKGRLEIRDGRIRDVEIGYPITVDYAIAGDMAGALTEIRTANLHLDHTPVSLQGTIRTKPSRSLDIRVQSSDASIAEAARLAAAFGLAFNARTDVSGRFDLNLHAQGSPGRLVLDGRANAREVNISGDELREPVRVKSINLTFSPESVRSGEFTATTGRTSLTAQFALSGYAADTPRLDAKLKTDNAELGELLRIADAYGVSALNGVTGEGAVSVNVAVSGPIREPEALTYSGTGSLRSASLNLPSFSKPLRIGSASLRFNANSVTLDNVVGSLGQTTAQGNLTVKNFKAPHLQFSLGADRIDLAEWQALTPARPEQPARAGSRAIAGSTQESWLNRATGAGQLLVETVVYDKLILNNVKSDVTLDRGIVTAKPVRAGLYRGEQLGTVVVNMRSRPATYSVDTQLQGVDANQLLSSISPVSETVFGILSATGNVRFNTAGRATDIAQSLNGKISLNLKDGRIAHTDLVQHLAIIGQFQRTAKAVEPFTKFIQLTGDFDVTNGVARTNNLKAIIETGSLAADGIVDLGQQKLNLRLTAVLSEEYSQAVGGPYIGGLMKTALANRNGELVIPVIVTGTFRNPVFAPDVEKVVRMKLDNLLPSTKSPGQLTTGILGQLLRREKAAGKPQEQNGKAAERPAQTEKTPQEPKPDGAIQTILDSILGKKKKEPPAAPNSKPN